MFDTAYLPCVKCKQLVGFQSKSGDCVLGIYIHPNVPDVVLPGCTDKPYDTKCKNCGAFLAVEIQVTAWTKVVAPKNPKGYVSISGPPDTESDES